MMYLVTTEAIDNGIWIDDPEGFDTEREAREFAATRKPPKGHCFGIYACELITAVHDLVGTPQVGAVPHD